MKECFFISLLKHLICLVHLAIGAQRDYISCWLCFVSFSYSQIILDCCLISTLFDSCQHIAIKERMRFYLMILMQWFFSSSTRRLWLRVGWNQNELIIIQSFSYLSFCKLWSECVLSDVSLHKKQKSNSWHTWHLKRGSYIFCIRISMR
jgi:hypothetical protein